MKPREAWLHFVGKERENGLVGLDGKETISARCQGATPFKTLQPLFSFSAQRKQFSRTDTMRWSSHEQNWKYVTRRNLAKPVHMYVMGHSIRESHGNLLNGTQLIIFIH